jgi:hypothetical protein
MDTQIATQKLLSSQTLTQKPKTLLEEGSDRAKNERLRDLYIYVPKAVLWLLRVYTISQTFSYLVYLQDFKEFSFYKQ